MLRTGEQYLEALNDGRRVWVGNELIDNVATHPKTSGMAHKIAEFYDLHNRPDLEDELTFVEWSGERRSMMWFRPRDAEGLRRRRTYYEAVARHLDATPYQRLPDANN